MNEVALHLIESVFPKVPVRQWVLSFPFSVRYALAYSPALVTKVLAIYIDMLVSRIVIMHTSMLITPGTMNTAVRIDGL